MTTFEKYRDDHVKRAERKVISRGENQFPARGPSLTAILYHMGVDYTEPGEKRDEERREIYRSILQCLGAHGVQAEIYAIQGDIDNGSEESSDYLRVIARDGEETGVNRYDLGGYQRYINRITGEVELPSDAA